MYVLKNMEMSIPLISEVYGKVVSLLKIIVE